MVKVDRDSVSAYGILESVSNTFDQTLLQFVQQLLTLTSGPSVKSDRNISVTIDIMPLRFDIHCKPSIKVRSEIIVGHCTAMYVSQLGAPAIVTLKC